MVAGLNPHADNAPGVNNARPGVNNARPGVNNARPGGNNARPGVNNARPGVNNALIFFFPSNLLFKALDDLCQQNKLKTFKNFLYWHVAKHSITETFVTLSQGKYVLVDL